MICVDPVGAAIESAGTIAWLLFSWVTFRAASDVIGAIPDRLDAVDVGDLLSEFAKKIWRKLA